MTRRRLRPDEIELWEKVAAATRRLHPDPVHLAPPPEFPPPVAAPPKNGAPVLPPFPSRPLPRPSPAVSVDLKPALADLVVARSGGMDRHRAEKLRRGRLAPEGRIDLHGMTQAEAHAALGGFLLASHGAGRRLVLVVTGKGRGEGARGILSHSVPRWLALPPFDRLVLHLAHAHPNHGGAGALYVYLRRKGRG